MAFQKMTLQEYEDDCQEIRRNPDGSVTFVFDQPGPRSSVFDPKPNVSITISKEDYERASIDPDLKV